jgi:hypothetical protein
MRMIKALANPYLFSILTLIFLVSILGCQNDEGKTILIKGNVDNTSATVQALVNGQVVDTDDTDSNGNYRVMVSNNAERVELRFMTNTFNVGRVIPLTPDSEVIFDVSIEPAVITINNWQVIQERLKLSGNDTITFDGPEADFSINGSGKDCIRLKGSSVLDISARNITVVDCGDGLITEGSTSLTFDAVENVNITTRTNGIRSSNDSSVFISSDNGIIISSNTANGIRSTGTSEVILDPQVTCTIFGSTNAISEGSNAFIDPDGCVLING